MIFVYLSSNPKTIYQQKKSCGMCWFWTNLKGETKSDIPTQCWAPRGGGQKLGQNGFLQITQKVKEILKKVSNKSCS